MLKNPQQLSAETSGFLRAEATSKEGSQVEKLGTQSAVGNMWLVILAKGDSLHFFADSAIYES